MIVYKCFTLLPFATFTYFASLTTFHILHCTYLTINNLMSQMNVVRQRRGYVVDKNIGDLLSSISVVFLMQLVYLALYI